ncbi:response regulator [Maribacter sp. MMG018]|uniref:response regulator n=1 Tax=Maribacter sp. MMG018 TaxID=2822688 RepID=UPI001B3843B3|nr:response regulator [Maribacter sp. MMG018]MBQ4913363.1 response regulator [Maribacter sp. MMG018]
MSPKKVLLIDDSEIDNYINKAVLSKSELVSEITIKTSGADALKYLESANEDSFPDIIFLDIRMPGMDGFEFMEHYIKLPENLTGQCKVFVLSSSIDPVDIEKSNSYKEIEKHLTKPLAHHPIEKLVLFHD